MKTKIIFILACFFTSSIAFSQTVNYAIDNPNGKGYIETATIEELNNSREMTPANVDKVETNSSRTTTAYPE